jgi:hypothetical protein
MNHMMFLVEVGVFSGIAVLFAIREIWLNSPKQIAKAEAKERAKQEAQNGG